MKEYIKPGIEIVEFQLLEAITDDVNLDEPFSKIEEGDEDW